MGKYSTYFSDLELKCKCCGQLEMEHSFMRDLHEARKIAQTPMAINSGFRCLTHNAAIGGSISSSHILGLAVDIKTVGSRERFVILNALIEVGFTRIGIAKTFIHVDGDAEKNPMVMWLY